MLASAKTGVATLAFLTALWPEKKVQVVEISPDGSYLAPWKHDEHDRAPCAYWNTSVQYTTALCSHFALSRMSPAVAQQARERALQCASDHDTDCVLSSEVGFSIPTAFVYDQYSGLKMVVAPKLLDLPPNTPSEEKEVAFYDPEYSTKQAQLRMNDTIHVEYYDAINKKVERGLFNGQDSYCIQMTRAAFSQGCWDNLD